MENREKIAVVWFKRDLRLKDNEAISKAIASGYKVLLLYVVEPMLEEDMHYSQRHWDFIKQSLVCLNQQLVNLDTRVLTVHGDFLTVLNQLQNYYSIAHLYSHQETGLLITYNRDKRVTRYCRNNTIPWTETINNGVLRGLLNREDWFEKWEAYMCAPQEKYEPTGDTFLNNEALNTIEEHMQKVSLNTSKSTFFQPGGTVNAWKYANSFFKDRYEKYSYHISKPEASRESCSRLSPYIAWGNISIRQVYHKAGEIQEKAKNKRHLSAFVSRLRWQAHFIQKFEMEHTMEKVSVNNAYHKLKKNLSEKYKKAWEEGQTGFPLVDASMRCLNTTGYINFRMRAMLVSFFTHLLWQPWQESSKHLSRNFLDFEPGIHFPQLQMQAGETGINSLRIYSPVKNSKEHDPDAIFIKKWVPELAGLPLPFIHEPYLMTYLDQQFANFKLGTDYPYPIVDIKENRKKASDILWNIKKSPAVKRENYRILNKHTLSNRKRLLPEDE